jgi:DsbC/DsbD-like thiol-disulfide interchange protein/cytochrome c biogenesis protein CcdA
MLRRLLILLGLLLAPALAHARGIEPQLVAEGPAPPGGTVDLAIVMHPAPGWHGYWLNPGDAGLPMQLDWTLPKGFAVGPLRYPVPSQLKIAGLMNYVYESDYAVLTQLKVPADAKGTIPIRADAHWLACTDRICVPESGQLSLDLTVGTGTPNRAEFDQWRQKLPQPLAALAHFEISGNAFRLAIPLPSAVKVDHPYVFPETDRPVDYAGEQHFSRSDDVLIAELPHKDGQPPQFSGVLALGNGSGLEFQAVPGPVPANGKPLGETGSASANALLWAVLGAIIGGILLNLMPCVFPILALKALHLARSGGEANHARREALAYTAGAIVGTGALGVALLAIKAGGSTVGWAFQLQEPRTVLLLLLLATAITLNLVGAFELPTIGGSARPAGSLGTGALAAFVATPCAGPFLGTALGTALALPLVAAVPVFASLGLGLGIPFILIAFIPPLRNRLPRPGAWMLRLQRFLAIPMAASAVAALWLLSREAGHEGLIIGVTATILIAIALVFVGMSQRRGGPLPITSLVLVAVAIVGTVAFAPEPRPVAAPTDGVAKWSDAAVQAELKQGHPVFVYFTADWCLSCKVNEAAAINRSEVQSAFKKSGVQVFAGDWTNGDPVITRFLESQGRAGVPFYLWYQPGKPPEQLPQVLTPAMLIERAQRNG